MAESMDGSIAARLAWLEDYVAIQQLISAYGPAADSSNWDMLKDLWAEDGVYEVGGFGDFAGHEQLRSIFASDFHKALLEAGSGHIASTPHIVIDGDRASATHHGTLFKQIDGEFVVIRLIASRWLLERRKGCWVAVRRTNELLQDNPRARALLARAAEGPSMD